LRFGPVSDPRGRYLFEGVIAGISGYGNAVGVPTVGGDLGIDESYSENPLVNVGCIGLLDSDRMVLARASTEGSLAVLLGSATGRDGIGGASVLASAAFVGGSPAPAAASADAVHGAAADKRSHVQVGDPYGEKRLIEACLEMLDAGVLEGLQDLGAAGLAGATSEVAARARRGMDVDVTAVPRREPGLTSVEVMTSESQERMLAIVSPGDLEVVSTICAKWEVHSAVVGTVTSTGRLRVHDGPDLVADIPAASLADEGPRYSRPSRRPAGLDERLAKAPPVPRDEDSASDLLRLLREPGIADSSWIWRQYDHVLFLATVSGPGAADATVLRLRGRRGALAVTVDGNARLGALDPRSGAAHAVAEACRNVACTGARPLALVNCLNFGNPERPEVMWQLSEAIDGIAEACGILGVPVVGGNVSLYNATHDRDILPTPVVMVLGVLDDLDRRIPGLALRAEGETLIQLGEDTRELGGSAWAWCVAEHREGAPPGVRLKEGAALGDLLGELARKGILSAAHDISEGGLGVCLAEMAISGDRGLTVEVGSAAELFSESAARAVVATPSPDQVEEAAHRFGVAASVLGLIGGEGAPLELGVSSLSLEKAAAAWRSGLPELLGS
jgi:phosphoribosylformylglycinamidine synthase subunit PurL